MGGFEDFVLSVAPGGGLVALVSFAVLAVWRGWLVPRATVDALDAAHKRVEAVRAEQLAEWKAAYVSSEEARRVQAEQLGALLELARTTEAMLRSLTNGVPR